MAIQNGVIKIKGKVGDLVGYKRKKKHVVRKRATSKKQTENSQKASRDFGSASHQASLVRKGFAPLVKLYGTGELVNRLNSWFLAIYDSIPKEQAGKKKLSNGNIALLQGFEFNFFRSFKELWHEDPIIRIEPEGLEITLSGGEINKLINLPRQFKVVQIKLMTFSLNLDDETDSEIIEADDLDIELSDEACLEETGLSLKLTHQGNKMLIVAMGISCGTNSSDSFSGDRRYKACKLVKVLHLKDGEVVHFSEPQSVPPLVIQKQAKPAWYNKKSKPSKS